MTNRDFYAKRSAAGFETLTPAREGDAKNRVVPLEAAPVDFSKPKPEARVRLKQCAPERALYLASDRKSLRAATGSLRHRLETLPARHPDRKGLVANAAKRPPWLDPDRQGAPTLMLFSLVDDRSGVAYQEYRSSKPPAALV